MTLTWLYMLSATVTTTLTFGALMYSDKDFSIVAANWDGVLRLQTMSSTRGVESYRRDAREAWPSTRHLEHGNLQRVASPMR